MKIIITSLFLVISQSISFAQDCDTLFLIDGRSYEIQVELITDDKVFFFHCEDRNKTERSMHLKFVKQIKKKGTIRKNASKTGQEFLSEEVNEELDDTNYKYEYRVEREESGLFTKNQYNIVVTGLVGFSGLVSLLVISAF